MNRSASDFGFRLFAFLLLHVFLSFKVVFRKDLSVRFGFYHGDYFDGVVFFFNSRVWGTLYPFGWIFFVGLLSSQ